MSAAPRVREDTQMAIRVGRIGCGTVGQAVAPRLTNGRERRARLVRVCARPNGRTRPGWLSPFVGWGDRFESLLEPDLDVVVELVEPWGQDRTAPNMNRDLAPVRTPISCSRKD